MTRTEVEIKPDMLTWAITRAGFTMGDFIEKEPRIKRWIEGEKKPTVKQLESFSKKVYLPFGYLFLPEPPVETLPIPFFRTNQKGARTVNINVFDTIMLIRQRQDWLIDYLKENEFQPLDFVGKFKNQGQVVEIVSHIRETLGLEKGWASQFSTWEEALTFLIQKVENSGIIAVFNGVVENNTHRPIEVEECRGFVLVDEIAPFIFINNSDSKAAQLFTIVHELAHIWTGHSAGFDFRNLQPADDPVEILCDKVAAEFLVPSDEFTRFWKGTPNIKAATRHFKVSEIVIARRALDTGSFTKKDFFDFYNDYINREFKKKENQSSGGDFYATAKKRISLTFAGHVINAVKSGKLLYRDAYRLTGLKGDTFQTFFNSQF
ncbi:MAG: ImmA/IrrE family metallo-endopeptidase [Bacteroidetes bacterium]|nr:ImmA/IrrE family metallo-endopeptidase [Bacteroidota bacterium]